MKFLVTGVNGQLGHDVMNEIIKRGHDGVGSDIAPIYTGVADSFPVTTMPYVALDITNKVVTENHLKTLMITHNMKDAIKYGNRLIMMNDGNIIYDVSGEEKQKLQVSDLLAKFEQASGGEFANDRMMLAH